MFENRLRVLLVLLGVFALIIVVRLVDLQVVRAGQFRKQVADRMILRPQWFPFVRGRILDRTGKVLVQDAPTWDLCVDYEIIAFNDYRDRLVKWWRRRGRYEALGVISNRSEDVDRALRLRIAEMWRDIEVFARVHDLAEPEDILQRTDAVIKRVDMIRAARIDRRKYEAEAGEIVVREERHAHPIVSGMDQALQVRARERFRSCPWVHIEPSSARTYAPDSTPFAHILGRMGRVDRDDLNQDPNKTDENDPNKGDEFAAYHPSDVRGISGVERLAEQRLRGRRGRLLADRKGDVIEDVPAERGQDVSLTISAELQRALYHLMQREMPAIKQSRGGAIVVLDAETREVLALVSYPSYDPARFSEDYDILRNDTIDMPLRFRAVADHYAPGSILKPLVGLCGLSYGAITLDTRFECNGVLDPAHPNRDRCWQIGHTGQRKHHGSLNLVEAIRGSCNIFMYHVGDALGSIDPLCAFFDMFGIGRASGIGLPEESLGINPTPAYLEGIGRSVVPAHRRQFAIGQGEVSVTPVQAANVIATYAAGRFKPVTLIRGEEKPEWTLPCSSAHWSAIHRGMCAVVNDPQGTAYRYARLENDRYVLCGKTGSATVFAQPVVYRIAYQEAPAGDVYFEDVPERAARPAIKAFERKHPNVTVLRDRVEPVQWWPPVGSAEARATTRFAHAWFGAFLQARGADGGPDWSAPSRIAFAVLVEYGGSGGHVSGPLAKEVAETVLDVFGPDLDY